MDFIYSFLAAKLKFMSDGPSGTKHRVCMGLYQLTTDRYNGFPVYKKIGGQMFLFVDEVGRWSVYKELHPKSGFLYNKEKKPTPDTPPVTGWR